MGPFFLPCLVCLRAGKSAEQYKHFVAIFYVARPLTRAFYALDDAAVDYYFVLNRYNNFVMSQNFHCC